MKGCSVADGYMGYVDGKYVLFASEADYREYLDQQCIFMDYKQCYNRFHECKKGGIYYGTFVWDVPRIKAGNIYFMLRSFCDGDGFADLADAYLNIEE